MHRGAFAGIPSPGPFHCLACQTYVTGTPSGHCPRCGYVPPVALPAPAPVATYSPLWLVVIAIIVAVVVLLR
jgi:hypothetical protein